MRRVLAVAVCVLAACAPPSGECGGSTCAANQRCDWTDGRCVDDRAPTLVVTAPLDASELTASSVLLSGNATDDDGWPKVEYSFDGATWTAVKVGDGGAFTEPMTLPPLDGAPLRLTVRATDVRGQVTTKVVGLSVDDVAPSCARMSPDDGQLFTHGTVAVRYAGAGYRTLELTLDGASVAPDVAAGEVSFSWPVPVEDWVVHTLALALTDAAGNTCLVQSTFIVDDVPPVMSFESPLEGQVFGPDDFGIGFANGPATDGSGVVDVFVDVDNGMGPIQSGVWGDHWIVGRDAPAGEDYVPHYARATGVDLAGNSTEIDVTWFADVVPPRLMITSPSPGQLFNASMFNGSDDVTVGWQVADGDPQLMVTSPQAPGQSFVPPAMSLPFTTSPLDDRKTYAVQLTASTRTGATNGSVSFVVDRVGPTIVFADPPINSRMVTGLVTLRFSEPVQEFWGTWNDAGTEVQFEPQDWGSGGYLYDLAGNPGVETTNIGWRAVPVYWDPATQGIGAVQALFALQDATQVRAAADRESVLSFAVYADGDVSWVTVDPFHGFLFDPGPGFRRCDPSSFQVAGYLKPDAGAFDYRYYSGSCFSSAYGYGANVATDLYSGYAYAPWFVLVGPYTDEIVTAPASVVPYAALDYDGGNFAYDRPGFASLVTPFTQVRGVQASASHWVISENGATGRWAAFGCDAGACDFVETGSFADALATPDYSFAVGLFCDLHVFNSSAADGGLVLETVSWTAGCPPTGCVAVSTTPIAGTSGAVVFDPRDETTFELISSSGSTFSISTGTLDSSCTPTLAHVVDNTVAEGLLSAQPVWMYGKAASVYLDANGFVRLYVSP